MSADIIEIFLTGDVGISSEERTCELVSTAEECLAVPGISFLKKSQKLLAQAMLL